MTTAFAKRVARGAKFLDVNHPDWATKINLSTLYMGNCSVCAMGQLFGHYSLGLDHFGLSDKKSHMNGFSTKFVSWDLYGEQYSELTRLWRKEIERRLAAA